MALNFLISCYMILIEKLRATTKPMHDELDNAMVPHIMNISSVNDYIQLLVAFYGFFKPVYDDIDKYINTSVLPDYHTRRKPAHILDNLRTLQYFNPVQHIAQQLPHINSTPSAFGALYVLEGSTLGGLMIKKMIADKLHLPDDQLSFFAGYGKQTKERWTKFIDVLNTAGTNSQSADSVVETAADTFLNFKKWLGVSYFESK